MFKLSKEEKRIFNMMVGLLSVELVVVAWMCMGFYNPFVHEVVSNCIF